ncbi:hypothetical protein A2Z41_03165 [Microgenomates group bacterium RBG_19FT_COMBO_39_10]|nr:MAG: hypothetical protein A2Z41_03165 [Microgenomates group bacterium RBG_19FT_COMBO_39_10]
MVENPERYKIAYVNGEIGQHPHIIDTEEGGIVRFGFSGNQLFPSCETAETVAQQLNSGVAPEEIEISFFKKRGENG